MRLPLLLLSTILMITSERLTAQFDRNEATDLIESFLIEFPEGSEIAVALVQGDSTLHLGCAKQGSDINNVDNRHAQFEIGSLTKVFTASLLAQLALQGEVAFDDPINKWLDYTALHGDRITLHHLANHTSGLPRLPNNLFGGDADPLNPYKDYNERDLQSFLESDWQLLSEPGLNHGYSNLGVGLLGTILAKASGESFDMLMQENIFDPLDMGASPMDRSKATSMLVQGLSAMGTPTSIWDFDALAGAGAIHSSTADMVNFLQWQMRESDGIVESLLEAPFALNSRVSAGRGWLMVQGQAGRQILCHNGATMGYSSSISMDREADLGVIILSNISAFHPRMGQMEALCFNLLKLLIDQ